MSTFGKIIIIVLGVHLLWGGALYLRRAPIEQDLINQVRDSLNRPEFSNVAVEFIGRKGILTGTVEHTESIAEAQRLAGKYWGVRTIDNRIQAVAENRRQAGSNTPAQADFPTSGDNAQQGKWAVVRGYQINGKFLLSGKLPDWLSRNRMITMAEEVYGPGNVAIALSIENDLRLPADLMENFRHFLEVHRFKVVGFESGDGNFSLKADLPQEFEKYRPINRVESAPMTVKPVTYQGTRTAADTTDVNLEFQRLELNKLLESFVITFDTSSVLLTDTSRQILGQAAKVLNCYSEINIEIRGHTDNTGATGYNQLLSSARARAVYNYLVGNDVAVERLKIIAYGESRSIASNSTAKGRRENRRVVLHAP